MIYISGHALDLHIQGVESTRARKGVYFSDSKQRVKSSEQKNGEHQDLGYHTFLQELYCVTSFWKTDF